ncbi:hypothetical protein J7L01_00130 [bacterium]|nr:hypothetical protein [bacterium]
MGQELINAIDEAIKNMGDYFTSHNLIDFILARPHYKIFYDADITDIMTQQHFNIKHFEQQLNREIGRHLRNLSQLNFVGYIGQGQENIHETETRCIGYYSKKNGM